MAYEVEGTDEWLEWFNRLTPPKHDKVAAAIGLLDEHLEILRKEGLI